MEKWIWVQKKLFHMTLGNFELTATRKIKEKILPDEQQINPCKEYVQFMEMVGLWLFEKKKREDKLILLDFLIEVVKRDVQVDLLTELYYKPECEINDFREKYFVPLSYVDEQGNEKRLVSTGIRQVDLSETVTLAIPWKKSRMKDQIIAIAKEGFVFDEDNHFPAFYFAGLDICCAPNGNHSIASGIIQRVGMIKAYIFDLTEIFPHVTTDGEHWLNAHTKEPLKNKWGALTVYDFRIAVLYELARKKHRYSK